MSDEKQAAIEKQMSEDERLTRLAGIAAGHCYDDFKWDKTNRVLFKTTGDLGALKYYSFAPLSNPSDAVIIEDRLQMDVSYVVCKTSVGQSLSIRVSDKHTGGAVFRTQRPGESSLETRMAAITQYAALCAIMEDSEEAKELMRINHGG